MSAAAIVALTDVRIRAIDQASHQKSEMRTRACPRGTTAAAQHHQYQRGSLPHRESIDGTEVTERTTA
jgi:hypothetical protein